MNAIGLKRGVNFAKRQKFVSVLIMFVVLLAGSVISGILQQKWFDENALYRIAETAKISLGTVYAADAYMNGRNLAFYAVIILAGRAFGLGDSLRFKKTVNSVMPIAVLSALVIAFVAAAPIWYDSIVYSAMLFLTVLLSGINSCMKGIMYSAGDVIRPTVISVARNAVQTVLMLVFMKFPNAYGFGFFACALFCQILDFIMSGAVLMFADRDLRPDIKSGFDFGIMLYALAFTVTAFLCSFELNSNMIMRVFESTYGLNLHSGVLASYNILSVVNGPLPLLVTLAISQACGADDADKAMVCAFAGGGFMFIFGLAYSIVAPLVASPFIDEFGIGFVVSFAFTTVMVAEIFVCALRARGSVLLPLIYAFFVDTLQFQLWGADISELTGIAFVTMILCLYICLIVNIIAIARRNKRRKAIKAAAAAGGAVQAANTAVISEPMKGEALKQPVEPKMNFDPMTGKPLNPPVQDSDTKY